jgi:hypothetical protein
MTTLFDIDKSKLSSFVSSLDDTLSSKLEENTLKYSFNFDEDKPLGTANSSFTWTPLTRHSD